MSTGELSTLDGTEKFVRWGRSYLVLMEEFMGYDPGYLSEHMRWDDIMPIWIKVCKICEHKSPTYQMQICDNKINGVWCYINIPDVREGYDWGDDCWNASPNIYNVVCNTPSLLYNVCQAVTCFLVWYQHETNKALLKLNI